MIRRRLTIVLAALALMSVPGVALGSPLDVVTLGPSSSSPPPDVPPITDKAGQRLVCYAPGFSSWVICINYP